MQAPARPVLVVFAVLANACYAASHGPSVPTSPAPAASRPELRWTDTALTFGTETRRVELAVVRVPEHRARVGSRLIDVAFIRLRSTAASPGTPVLFLPGSPGGASGTQTLRATAFLPFFEILRAAGDVIVLDYRGSGLSTPRLMCPRTEVFPADAFASRANAFRLFEDQARRCAATQSAAGTDLAGYTWMEIAEDIEDVRRALNVPKVTLVGFSSGTQAALAALRAHQSSYERVVFLGSEGPDHTRKLPLAMDRQLAAIDVMIGETQALRANIPDFKALVSRVLTRLDTQPAIVKITMPNGTRLTGPVGRFALEFITSRSLSGPDEFAMLPALYASLDHGDASRLSRVLQGFVNRPTPSPLAYVLDGASGVSADRAARIRAEEPMSLLGRGLSFPFPDIGAAWGYADLGDAYRAPVRSRVPSLFVTGALDGNTPVEQADLIRRGFANSVHVVVRRAGHTAVLGSTAVAETIVAFLQGRNVRDARLFVTNPPLAPLPR